MSAGSRWGHVDLQEGSHRCGATRDRKARSTRRKRRTGVSPPQRPCSSCFLCSRSWACSSVEKLLEDTQLVALITARPVPLLCLAWNPRRFLLPPCVSPCTGANRRHSQDEPPSSTLFAEVGGIRLCGQLVGTRTETRLLGLQTHCPGPRHWGVPHLETFSPCWLPWSGGCRPAGHKGNTSDCSVVAAITPWKERSDIRGPKGLLARKAWPQGCPRTVWHLARGGAFLLQGCVLPNSLGNVLHAPRVLSCRGEWGRARDSADWEACPYLQSEPSAHLCRAG